MLIRYLEGRYVFEIDETDNIAANKVKAKLESLKRYKLPTIKVSRNPNIYYCPDSLYNVAQILTLFPKSVSNDATTQEKIKKSVATAIRLSALQKGTDSYNEPKLPNCIDYILDPFKHQKEAIAFALYLDKCALFLDLGLGKTYTSLTIVKLRNKLYNNVHKVLCIVPKSLIYQWCSEIERFVPGAKIYRSDVKKSTFTLFFPDDLATNYDKEGLTFCLTSYESLESRVKPIKEASFDMFILDESAKIKNPDAIRTKNTLKVCSSIPYGLELTGMPYINSPLDMYSQMMLIDPTLYGINRHIFESRYIIYDIFRGRRIPKGVRNFKELRDKAYCAAFSRTKEQCLDLPDKVYETRRLPLYDTQHRLYTKLVREVYDAIDMVSDNETHVVVTEKGEHIEVTIEYVIALMEKLQQITSGFVVDDYGDTKFIDSPKYEQLLDIVSSSSDSFLIWARHRTVIETIKNTLSKANIECAVLDRTVTGENRASIKKRFKEGTLKVIILQIQSECRGNDLTCKVGPVTAVFFENTMSIEERIQAEGRQHRIGMTGTALYIDLICKDTYDEGIELLLKTKEKLSTYIRNKDYKLILGKGESYMTRTSGRRVACPPKVEEKGDKNGAHKPQKL